VCVCTCVISAVQKGLAHDWRRHQCMITTGKTSAAQRRDIGRIDVSTHGREHQQNLSTGAMPTRSWDMQRRYGVATIACNNVGTLWDERKWIGKISRPPDDLVVAVVNLTPGSTKVDRGIDALSCNLHSPCPGRCQTLQNCVASQCNLCEFSFNGSEFSFNGRILHEWIACNQRAQTANLRPTNIPRTDDRGFLT
jgi:hypothetical protein